MSKLQLILETREPDGSPILLSSVGSVLRDLRFLHGHNSNQVSEWTLANILEYGSRHSLYESLLALYIDRPVDSVSDEILEYLSHIDWTDGEMNPQENYAILLSRTPLFNDEDLVLSISEYYYSGFRSASLHALATYYPHSFGLVVDLIRNTKMSDIMNTGELICFSNILRFWREKNILSVPNFVELYVSRGGSLDDERLQAISNLSAAHVFDLPFPEFRM